MISIHILLSCLNQIKTTLQLVQLCTVSRIVVSRQILRVIWLTHWSQRVWHHVAKVVIVVLILILLLLSLRIINKTILIRIYRNVSVAWISKFLHFEGLLNKNIFNIVRKIVYFKFLRIFKTWFFFLVRNLETQVVNLSFVPNIKSCFTYHSFRFSWVLRILRLLRKIISYWVYLFLASFWLESERNTARMKRVKAMNSWHLLIKSFDISFMLTFSSKFWSFFFFSSLSHLNSLKNAILNQDSKKIQRSYQLSLHSLDRIDSPLFLRLIPLS